MRRLLATLFAAGILSLAPTLMGEEFNSKLRGFPRTAITAHVCALAQDETGARTCG
ncbi:MAG TPA: hypothetical protein VHT73_16345 [Thermodesulfobacteriota bacterium]|nr:hypothetical protein [Thermodesulfobacteriota bacterium]